VATDSSVALSLSGLRLARGRSTVFDGLSLRLAQRRIALIGDNGAGKTSLLRLLAGLESASAGTLETHGLRLGLMFQNPDDQIIFPTVEEEVALGFEGRGQRRRDAVQAARAWLGERGLAHWAERAVGSLSQGQRQYLCWLSLLASGPDWLLLDEPFASLDLPGQALLRAELARVDQPMVLATHMLGQVLDFDRAIWIEQGRVKADGSPREICAAYQAEVAARVAARGQERFADPELFH